MDSRNSPNGLTTSMLLVHSLRRSALRFCFQLCALSLIANQLPASCAETDTKSSGTTNSESKSDQTPQSTRQIRLELSDELRLIFDSTPRWASAAESTSSGSDSTSRTDESRAVGTVQYNSENQNREGAAPKAEPQRLPTKPVRSLTLSASGLHSNAPEALSSDESESKSSRSGEAGPKVVFRRVELNPPANGTKADKPASEDVSSSEDEDAPSIRANTETEKKTAVAEAAPEPADSDVGTEEAAAENSNELKVEQKDGPAVKVNELGQSPAEESQTGKETEGTADQHSDKGECPGAPDSKSQKQEPGPDDVELEQDDHPFDAPPAKKLPEAYSIRSDEPQFTSRELAIRTGISNTLQHFIKYPENVVRRGPWALMHATLPFGVETEVVAGNRRVNAIGWMCYNGVCAKQRMFQATRRGFRTNVGPGVQGHEGQFLAILAQSKVQSSYPIRIGNRSYTIKDLVQYEMATCREKSELTFKLIGLSFYLDQNQTWRDNRGHYWNLEKMVVEELAQPINGAACGGSHRLMALSFALLERKKSGLPITGNWARTERYLNDYVSYALSLQNPDGSFSTEWFESRGQKPDVERKVQTTGHILEWLIFTLPDEHLRSERIQRSVEFLINSVGSNPTHDWPIGPRGHALRALSLYSQRVFGAEPGQMQQYVAETQSPRSLR